MIRPHDNDVLSGRGNGVGNHDGNIQFRAIVANYVEAYEQTTSNASKKAVAMEIRRKVESLHPPGRFLSEKHGLYYPQNEKEILGKIKQALRDKMKAERPKVATRVVPRSDMMSHSLPTQPTQPIETPSPHSSSVTNMFTNFFSSLRSLRSVENPTNDASHIGSNDEYQPYAYPAQHSVSKRSLNIMNEVFRTDGHNITEPIPIPSNDGNGYAKGMLPRQYRMMHKNLEPTDTIDSELNAINMSVGNMSIEYEPPHPPERGYSPLPFNASPEFQMDEIFSNDADILPDNVIGPALLSDTAMNMGSLFSLEDYSSTKFMEL